MPSSSSFASSRPMLMSTSPETAAAPIWRSFRAPSRFRTASTVSAGLLFAAPAVPRNLQQERLARFGLARHELDAALGGEIRLLRVRRVRVLGPPLLFAPSFSSKPCREGLAAHVPFAEVRGRVAGAFEQFRHRDLGFGEVEQRLRRDQLYGCCRPRRDGPPDIGHAQQRRRLAREQGRARRRAAAAMRRRRPRIDMPSRARRPDWAFERRRCARPAGRRPSARMCSSTSAPRPAER